MMNRTLSDQTEQAQIRYVSFMGDSRRYDIAIVKSDQQQDKSLIIDLQRSRYTEVHDRDIEDIDYFCHFLHLNNYEAEELQEYLTNVFDEETTLH
ncbi:SAV0927 family protein [Alkalibacillus aidingensis]|uniref:SAV0927 family protein n=1 Tax=Alkalibacillus aidingensis TaxID=2747607 RepID=UPI0016600768|nr:SAV0927 family protein [Alkalibacillus aidingensis]